MGERSARWQPVVRNHLSTVDARAVDEYQVQALASEVFQLTWELEVRSKPLMNGNDYAVAAQGGEEAFAAASDELDVIVNEEIPAI